MVKQVRRKNSPERFKILSKRIEKIFPQQRLRPMLLKNVFFLAESEPLGEKYFLKKGSSGFCVGVHPLLRVRGGEGEL